MRRYGILIVLAALGGYVAWSWTTHSVKYDAAFCAKNLAYYEQFCTTYPKNCTEGPRKLARCEP